MQNICEHRLIPSSKYLFAFGNNNLSNKLNIPALEIIDEQTFAST